MLDTNTQDESGASSREPTSPNEHEAVSTEDDSETDGDRVANGGTEIDGDTGIDGDPRTDGGTETADYLETEINLFKPATPFMRDHLKLVWTTFALWVLFVFGPVTAAAIAPDVMTGTIVLGFQLHFLLTAIGAPLGALVLSVVYSWRRDALDEKYGIDHETSASSTTATTAADGGEES